MLQNNKVFAFLWQHIKPYKKYYAMMLSAAILGAGHALGYNYAIKLFIRAFMQKEVVSWKALSFPIICFIVNELIFHSIWKVSHIASWYAIPKVRASILTNAYNKVQKHHYAFFQDHYAGAITSKIRALIDGYDRFWESLHHGLVARFIGMLLYFSTLMSIHSYLGIGIMTWAILYTFFMWRISKKLGPLSAEEAESKHSLVAEISDQVTNIFSVFTYGARERTHDALVKQSKDTFIPKQRSYYRYFFFRSLMDSFCYLFILFTVLTSMIHLRLQGQISIEDFAFVFGLFFAALTALWRFNITLPGLVRAYGDLKSALSILNHPSEDTDQPGAQPLILQEPSIEVNRVVFGYDNGHRVFNELSIFIGAGEKVGLVGVSGAGKSSLVSLLLRLFTPDKGCIKIGGIDIAEVTQNSLREQIALIPQDITLFHHTIIENISYGKPQATEEEVIEACQLAGLDHFIAQLPKGYNTEVGERGVKLSGGQRQRIAIARAMIKKAPILILDEATSALDSQTEADIQRGLDQLLKQGNMTCLAIAHRLSTHKYMDRFIVIDQGKVVEEGTHEQLLARKSSLYKKLWEQQQIDVPREKEET